jgi:ribosomal protein L11 methyltransferase
MENTEMRDAWWKVTCTPNTLPDPYQVSELLDELGFNLIDLGAVSTAIELPPDIICFFKGTKEECDSFLESIPQLNVSIIECREVTENNWNEGCPEVWVPIDAGRFHVVPVSSASDPRPIPEGSLKIIPGQGFGTGHHATTKMVLEELSAFCEKCSSLTTPALDFGTGSGILAIAAVKGLGCVVDATDIDQDALHNAADNASLNACAEQIRLSLTPLEQLSGPYELLLANVYAEVLVASCGELTRLASAGAFLLLSGMTELVKDSVADAFTETGAWELVRERAENGWNCLVLKKS